MRRPLFANQAGPCVEFWLAIATAYASDIARLSPSAQCSFDFLVGGVLTQSVHGPDRGGDPADQCELQNQADDAGNRTANREKLEPRNNQGEQKAH